MRGHEVTQTGCGWGRPAEGLALGPSPWVDGGCVVSQGAAVVLMGVSECERWVVSATVVLLGVSECEGGGGECYGGADGCLCCSGYEGWVVSCYSGVDGC